MKFFRPGLLLPTLLFAGAISVRAQSFFTSPTAQYRTPAWRGSTGTEFSRWDVFSSPYGDPLSASDGWNFPDLAAPNGVAGLASALGFTPPANADPVDPFAFWHAANPTIRQTATTSAFIIGAGTAGNIYSFAAVTGYEVGDATPYPLGTVVFQWQADGQLLDPTSLKLVAGANEYAPTNFITEFKAGTSGFGGVTNRAAAQWDLTGLGIASYTIRFQSEGSSTSFQEALLDTAPTYVEAVPSDRTWTAASGAWSDAAAWSLGSLPPTGGNVNIASGASLTVDGGVREIGDLRISVPGAYAIAAGGGTVKLNTGISATSTAPASYTITAPVALGAFNLTFLPAQTELIFDAPISGAAGFYLSGFGRMKLNAVNPFTGPVTVDEGTLEIAGAKTGAGAITVFEDATLTGAGTVAGAVTMHGTHAPGAGLGTLTHTGALSYRATAHLSWQLGSNTTTAGGSDRVAAAAVTVAAGARLEVKLDAPGGAVDFRQLFWRSPRAWPVLTSTTLTGTFALGTVSPDAVGSLAENYGTWALAHAPSGVTLHWTPRPAWESWRRVSFGAQWNDAAVAGELVDAEQDGLRNVVEYALAGNGAAATAPPHATKLGNRLTLTFARNAAATDTTLRVLGADSVLGPWTALAESVGGVPLVPLLAGVSVAETAGDPAPLVEVRDLFTATDPAHPRRFLRLEATRQP